MTPAEPSSNIAAVSIRGVRKTFGGGETAVHAVDGVDLDIVDGEFFCLLGPSGSGKTTLLRMIAGFELPTAGSILLQGRDVTRLPPSARAGWRRRNVGLVLQRDNLHPHLNVADNVALTLRLQGLAVAEIRNRVAELLHLVGLRHCSLHFMGQLSGGEAQRAAIAVALAPRPGVLLADEPTGELDEATAGGILDLLDGLVADQGLAILTATHNKQVEARAGHHLAIRDGQVIHAR